MTFSYLKQNIFTALPIPKELLPLFTNYGDSHIFHKKQYICERGTPDFFIYIKSGLVGDCFTEFSTINTPTNILLSGTISNLGCEFFIKQKSKGFITVWRNQTEVIKTSYKTVHSLLKDSPFLERKLTEYLFQLQQRTIRQLIAISCLSVESRLTLLLESLTSSLSVTTHENMIELPIKLTHTEYAWLTHASNSSINKILDEWIGKDVYRLTKNSTLIHESLTKQDYEAFAYKNTSFAWPSL